MLAAKLKGLRTENHLTQEQVANRAGISCKTYQRYEKGKLRNNRPVNPEFYTLASIAGVFRIDVAALLDFTDTALDPKIVEEFFPDVLQGEPAPGEDVAAEEHKDVDLEDDAEPFEGDAAGTQGDASA